MTRFKLLAVDVDGTLVGSDQQVSPRNRQAVEAAKDAGLTVCLTTGRGVKEVLPAHRACGLEGRPDPLICTSGALICEGHTTRTLHIEPVDRATAAAGCEAIVAAGHTAVALVDPWRWGFDYIVMGGNDIDRVRQCWLDQYDFGLRCVDHLDEVPGEPDILRLTAIADGDDAAAVRDALADRCGDRLRVETIRAPNYDITVVECFGLSADKWRGASYVAAGLGVGARDIAAIGDDINDLPLFAGAGLACAMGQAADPIRDAADVVTAGHDDDGFARFVDKLLAGRFD